MRYLVIFKEDSAAAKSHPAAVALELLDGKQGYFAKLQEQQKIDYWGHFATSHGVFGIYNADSHAELYQLIESSPVRNLCTVEAHPLLDPPDFDAAWTEVKKSYSAIAERLASQQSR